MPVRAFFGEGEIVAPPRANHVPWLSPGFVMCPLALQTPFLYDRGVQEMYLLAYEQARAAHHPTWYGQLTRTSRN
jgi:hypothetical protein